MYRTNITLKGVNKSTGQGKITIEVTFLMGSLRERVYIPTGEKLPIEFWRNGKISRAHPNSKDIITRIGVIHHEIKTLLFDLERQYGSVNKNLFNDAYFGQGETDQDLLVLLDKFIEVKDLISRN
uniref:hypothetical protein n=1 Tax=Algoriphagus sp. TaxID=1872435 RepID=UPI0040473C2E